MLGEKILLMLSKQSQTPDYIVPGKTYTIDNALDTLLSSFGLSFLEKIKGKTVLDYGCGAGYQVVAMALKGAKFVVGFDIRTDVFKEGINLSRKYNVSTRVKFTNKLNNTDKFDVIISQNSFEHYKDPYDILQTWKMLTNNDGKIFITLAPPWYAPYGSHTYFFTKLPWVNLLFSETTVMKVRSRFRNDGAKRYQDVEGGLNKITVKGFETLVRKSGFDIKYMNYSAVKDMNIFTKLPFLREFMINKIDCILSRAER